MATPSQKNSMVQVSSAFSNPSIVGSSEFPAVPVSDDMTNTTQRVVGAADVGAASADQPAGGHLRRLEPCRL